MEMLEKCPFCGGEAGYDEIQKRYGVVFSIYCEECGVEMTKLNSEAAIEAWNRRVE
jgi:Lar family restriction alleviation protein